MSLSSLWKSQEAELASKHVQAMVGLAGDGKLRDGNKACVEFREFLAHISSSYLNRYATECLNADKFADSGCVLQDVINEVGRRLGFSVENGLYRGTVNDIGQDGLWRADDEAAIIIEVKTSDSFTIDLDTLAEYRKSLAADKRIDFEKSSILIVVGRSNTDSLEAQVRGSRHAWDVRLISVEALLRLLSVKEELEDPKVVQKIRQILRPKEFTKVDEIIDLVFSAAEDVRQEDELQSAVSVEDGEKKFTPVNFRDECITRLQAHLSLVLIKRSLALYSTADQKSAVLCLNSRKHEQGKLPRYWFAFHPHQKTTLERYQAAFVAFGCGGASQLLLIPASDFLPWLDRFWTTELEDRMYWHVRIVGDSSKFTMDTKAGASPLNVTKYLLR